MIGMKKSKISATEAKSLVVNDDDEEEEFSLRNDISNRPFSKSSSSSSSTRWIPLVGVILVGLLIVIMTMAKGDNNNKEPPSWEYNKEPPPEVATAAPSAQQITERPSIELAWPMETVATTLGPSEDATTLVPENMPTLGPSAVQVTLSPSENTSAHDDDAKDSVTTDGQGQMAPHRPDEHGGWLDDDLPQDLIQEAMDKLAGLEVDDSVSPQLSHNPDIVTSEHDNSTMGNDDVSTNEENLSEEKVEENSIEDINEMPTNNETTAGSDAKSETQWHWGVVTSEDTKPDENSSGGSEESNAEVQQEENSSKAREGGDVSDEAPAVSKGGVWYSDEGSQTYQSSSSNGDNAHDTTSNDVAHSDDLETKKTVYGSDNANDIPDGDVVTDEGSSKEESADPEEEDQNALVKEEEEEEHESKGGIWFEDERAKPVTVVKDTKKPVHDKNQPSADAPSLSPTAVDSSSLTPTVEPSQSSSESESTTNSPSPANHHDTVEEEDLQASEDESPQSTDEEEFPPLRTTAVYQYKKRGAEYKPRYMKQLGEKWGTWTLKDDKASQRPQDDYCGAYPNRDIPWKQIPSNAWQRDSKYVAKFLSEGKALVERAMEVHLAEYGFGPDDLPGQNFEQRRDESPFKLEIVKNDDRAKQRRLTLGVNDRAGWTTQKSFDGLVRRLLHAVVSGDSFNLVLGGHSAAAGHGNHFQQSYALQFQRVMEPIFARLGVKHYSRNTGMGGLGTIHNAMGAQDIYGRDVDILIWDSSMTESSTSPDFDLFARQGILGSDRAPMLWAGIDEKEVYPELHKHADVDYMMYGSGLGPLPSIADPTMIDEIPWAARYLKCDPDWQSLCKDNRYNGTCWIERPDHFVPPTPQKPVPGGRAGWHEGNREHQLYGRTLSFTVLRALHEALHKWDKQPQRKLKDSMWHVSDYYENIRSKVANLDPSIGTCYEIEPRLPTVFCKTPFQARTEFTPRANPAETSVRSIMKPFGPDGTIPQPEMNIYDPPDVYNPFLGVPEGEVDYLAIIENGVDFVPFEAPVSPTPPTSTNNRLIDLTADDNGELIVPGLGWGLNTKASPHLCDGTYDSFCGRSAEHECLLYGHNDYRGGLTFDSLSGWGIFTLRNLKEGKIFVKMDSWRSAKDNPVTEGWTAENNGRDDARDLTSDVGEGHNQQGSIRRLAKKKKKKQQKGEEDRPKFCPDFLLEFAIGDRVVRIKSDEILGERHSLVQRVVQIWTVLDDPDFTKGETLDVELGVRIRGCDRQHVFWLSSIYWA